MENLPTPLSCAAPGHDSGFIMEGEEEEGRRMVAAATIVDSFLIEALHNPRHRLTVLRMELDIQRFMQYGDQLQFEFQHLPTSYLRCAAHRVAQHYGLQTIALDNAIDGFVGRVVARKTPDTKLPAIRLSDIPMKQPETEKSEQVKIVIRPRRNQSSSGDSNDKGTGINLMRTVEERKEEYDKARARIFSSPSIPDVEISSPVMNVNRDEQEYWKTVAIVEEKEKIGIKDGASTVAIFRDKDKDRTDPDYDRSYDRYARGFVPSHDFNLGACNLLQPSFLQYELGFQQVGQFPRTQTSMGYMQSNSTITPYGAVGCSQTTPDAVYMHWPTPSMVYAHSYDHFRHAIYPYRQRIKSFCKTLCFPPEGSSTARQFVGIDGDL